MQEWVRQRERDELRQLQIQQIRRKEWRAQEAQNSKDAGDMALLLGVGALVLLAVVCLPLFLLFVGVKWLTKGGWIKRVFSLIFIPTGAFGLIYIYWFAYGCVYIPGTPTIRYVAAVALQRTFHVPNGDAAKGGTSFEPVQLQRMTPTATVSTGQAAKTTEASSSQESVKAVPSPEMQPTPASPVARAASDDAANVALIVASFDCAKASSPIEHLICSTPDTGDADRRLAAAYSAARAKSSDPAALKADQRNWMKSERDACSDALCLLSVTEARIEKLSAM
jgi:uncharacterized protein YecT (DUF1311 family)